MTSLSTPLRLACGATLPNRLAKASMSEQLAERSGAPSAEMIRLYERWGQGGAGLLISGHVMIDSRHVAEAGNVKLEDEQGLEALSRWAKAATSGGAQAWLQLNHPGRQTPRLFDAAPVAPSAVPLEVGGRLFATPRELSEGEIWDLIERFAHAAAVAQKAGVTGVEIHGAHGYLVSQFLSPTTNRRRDAWGGDATRRRRFLLEVARAIRAAVAPTFAVGVKLNSADFQRGGFNENDAMEVIAALGEERIDLLEISGGTYERAVMFGERAPESTLQREAFFLDFAEQAKRVATMPLMLTGGFRTRAAMEAAISSGAVDVIGLARPLAIEPELPAALLRGEARGSQAPRLATGFKTLDSIITGSWYQQQLRRMGRGLEPLPSLTRGGALAYYLADFLREGRTRVRAPGSA